MARRDAERNRALLVAAGREVFAEQGPDASLEGIARRAGVGIGTLYRHFPSREALVEVIYAEHFAEVLAVAEEAAAAEDAWGGLVGFLERVLGLQSRNLPLRAAFLRQPHARGVLAERRRQIEPVLQRVLASAHEQGSLRADFTFADLSLVIWSFAPILEATAGVAPDAWKRHLNLLLDGMRAEAATPQAEKPLTGPQLDTAIETLRGRYHRRRAVA